MPIRKLTLYGQSRSTSRIAWTAASRSRPDFLQQFLHLGEVLANGEQLIDTEIE